LNAACGTPKIEPVRLAVRVPLIVLALASVAACTNGSGSGSATTPTTPTTPSPPTPGPPSGGATQFGAGSHVVGTAGIAAGRYYSVPVSGCYWERRSGSSGTVADIIVNEVITYSAGQWIVDILSSDAGFMSSAECGTWFNTARRGALGTSIPPGVWLVGSQITPGTYSADAGDGCYWERRSSFEGTLTSIIDNDFLDAGPATVTIAASDTGFLSDVACGNWTRTAGIITPAPLQAARPHSPADIATAWRGSRSNGN
jgi:hypothetical protein